MVQELRTRVDFYGSQIFCNTQGAIYDVTGRGLTNLHDCTLETIEDAERCFKEDLVRILEQLI